MCIRDRFGVGFKGDTAMMFCNVIDFFPEYALEWEWTCNESDFEPPAPITSSEQYMGFDSAS